MTDVSIFAGTTTAPAWATTTDNVNYFTLGTEFYVTAAAVLKGISYYRHSSAVASSVPAAVYAVNPDGSTGSLIVGTSVTISAGAATGWITAQLDTPVALAPNQPYRVAVYFGRQIVQNATAGYWGGPSVTRGVLVAPSYAAATGTNKQGCYAFGSTQALQFPGSGDSVHNAYGVDVLISDVPPGPQTVSAGTRATTRSVGNPALVSGAITRAPAGVPSKRTTGSPTVVAGPPPPRRNLLPNPSFETGVAGWKVGFVRSGVTASVPAGSAPSRSSASATAGAYHGYVSATGNGTAGGSSSDVDLWTPPVPVEPGRVYVFSTSLQASTDGVTDRIVLQWLDASGASLRTDISAAYSAPNGVWGSAYAGARAPAGATQLRGEVWWFGPADSTFRTYRLDAAQIEAAPALRPYADGDSVGWTWDGVPHASTSRLADAFALAGRASTRTVGMPTVTATGFRLGTRSSARTAGSPTLALGPARVAPAARPAAARGGAPAVSGDAVALAVDSRPAAATTGRPGVVPGPVTLAVVGRPSGAPVADGIGTTPLGEGPLGEGNAGQPAPTVLVGPPKIYPVGRASTVTTGAPSATAGPIAVALGGRSAARTLGSPVVLPGAVVCAPDARESTAGAGDPVLALGPATVALSGRGSTDTSGRPALAVGPVTAPVGARAATAVAGAPTLAPGRATRTPAGRSSTATTGSPALAVGTATVALTGRPSTSQAGDAFVELYGVGIRPAGRPAAAQGGAPTLTAGPVTRALGVRFSGATTGRATVTPGPIARTPAVRPFSATVGAPLTAPGPIARGVAGRPARATTGRPGINPALPVAGRTSTATAGRPATRPGPVGLTTDGRANTRATGKPALAQGVVSRPVAGRAPASIGGRLTITVGPVVLRPDTRPAGRSTGVPALGLGTATLRVLGRSYARTVGAPGTSPGPITVALSGRDPESAVGFALTSFGLLIAVRPGRLVASSGLSPYLVASDGLPEEVDA